MSAAMAARRSPRLPSLSARAGPLLSPGAPDGHPGPYLVDRVLDGEPVDRLQHPPPVVRAAGHATDVAQRPVGHRRADERAHGHAGELLLDPSELGDRLPELPALLR